MRKLSQKQLHRQKYSLINHFDGQRISAAGASEIKQEQEDEVNRTNCLILRAKCHATRDV
jgi:hypothetical protein